MICIHCVRYTHAYLFGLEGKRSLHGLLLYLIIKILMTYFYLLTTTIIVFKTYMHIVICGTI